MNSANRPNSRIRRELIAAARSTVATDLGWQSRQFTRRIAARLDEALAPTGVNSVQFSLMCLVASSPDDTIAGLARAADLDASTLSRNLAHLQRAELVEIVMVEKDRRRRSVWLSETGLRVLERGMPVWREVHEWLLAKLDRDLPEAIASALGSLPPVRAETESVLRPGREKDA